MAGWHHRLDGHEFGWTPGVGDGQGGLVCCSSWVHKELDTTEWLNWTERYPCSNPCSLWIRPFMAKKNFADMIKLRLWRYKITLYYLHLCVHTKSHQSCSALCDPMDCSLPNSSVHGILQARILKWVAMPSSRGSSQPRDQTHISYVSCIGKWGFLVFCVCVFFFTISANYLWGP